jgi:hypothetical protein
VPNTPVTRGELFEALQKLGEAPRYRELEPEASENGPVQRPVAKYSQIPEPTRDWLERLRPDDIKEIDDVRRWFRNTRIISAFGKWVVVALVAILVATGQISKAFVEVISYLQGAP